jgi:hypothetical protein
MWHPWEERLAIMVLGSIIGALLFGYLSREHGDPKYDRMRIQGTVYGYMTVGTDTLQHDTLWLDGWYLPLADNGQPATDN